MEEVGANKYFLLEGLHPAFSEFAIDMLMPPVQSDGLENKLNTQPDYETKGRSSIHFGENAIYKALGKQDKTTFKIQDLEIKNQILTYMQNVLDFQLGDEEKYIFLQQDPRGMITYTTCRAIEAFGMLLLFMRLYII